MSYNLTNLLYLVTIVTFILALRFLSSPAHARRGNQIGAAGMLVAIAVTFARSGLTSYWAIARSPANPALRPDERLAAFWFVAMRIDTLAVDNEREGHRSGHAGSPAQRSGRESRVDTQRTNNTFAKCRRMEGVAC